MAVGYMQDAGWQGASEGGDPSNEFLTNDGRMRGGPK
jgi:hypothetical protein